MTIDITELVENLRQTWVVWAVDTAYAAVVIQPGFQWLAFPVISTLFKKVLEAVANALSKTAEQQAFFLNTAVRKASQSVDFTEAVKKKNSLPEDVSDEDYRKAELAQMDAFRSFVRVTT